MSIRRLRVLWFVTLVPAALGLFLSATAGCGGGGAATSALADKPVADEAKAGNATEAATPAPAPEAHDAAWVTAECTRYYEQVESNWATYMPKEQATSDFKRCPKWRMAAPDICGSPVQPSFLDACHCMCDLCERDADCTARAGGVCAEMSSVFLGGYAERVCVYEGDACHPKAARKCATHCVTSFGQPQCVSKDKLK